MPPSKPPSPSHFHQKHSGFLILGRWDSLDHCRFKTSIEESFWTMVSFCHKGKSALKSVDVVQQLFFLIANWFGMYNIEKLVETFNE